MRNLPARPLTREAFAPFGGVLEVPEDTSAGRVVNMGTARRFDRVLEVANLRAGASLNVAVFRCQAFTGARYEIAELEKHPGSGQLFVPMVAERYLVAVALGAESPDLSSLAVFVAGPDQGVCYGPSVWHQPLIALGRDADFACFVHEDGTSGDCVPHRLSPEEIVVVDLLSGPTRA